MESDLMAEPVQLYDGGVYLLDGATMDPRKAGCRARGRPRTAHAGPPARAVAHGILAAHDTSGGMDRLKLRFDALASHDITYVGVIRPPRRPA